MLALNPIRLGGQVLVAAMLLVPLMACAATEGSSLKTSTLVGSQWAATSIEGEPVLADPLSTLTFESEDRVYGNTACNNYRGAVAQDGQSFAMGPFAATQMFCQEPINGQEKRFLAALGDAKQIAMNKGQLMLLDEQGETLVIFERLK